MRTAGSAIHLEKDKAYKLLVEFSHSPATAGGGGRGGRGGRGFGGAPGAGAVFAPDGGGGGFGRGGRGGGGPFRRHTGKSRRYHSALG